VSVDRVEEEMLRLCTGLFGDLWLMTAACVIFPGRLSSAPPDQTDRRTGQCGTARSTETEHNQLQ